MNVLSLFDGMSCGQIALNELGMFPDKYYACEIDKFAIAQTKLNFPDTIMLGDVTKLDVSKLEKIDLLIGGSPCQSFSFAGKMEGMSTEDNEEITTLERYLELKEKGFKFAGQSYLFWEYVRILKEVRKVNPNVLFLLENVRMLSKWEDVINRTLGVKGIHINSALVSAQIRKRIYWTNIAEISQPEDKRIFLRDILQSSVPEKYYLSDRATIWLNRHADKLGHKVVVKGGGNKSNCITVSGLTKSNLATCYVEVPEEHYLEDVDISEMEVYLKELFPRVRGLSITKDGIRPHRGDEKKSGLGELKTILFETAKKTGTLLTSASSVPFLIAKRRLRRLTPTEAARLQTVPYWYKWECSDTQQYKMLGNGWTVAVIYHIFSFIK
ncbi:hypothetical protein HNL35_40 [Bacteroides phage HNL35]|nr:hypothetical protein HNL05_40 [Bacteroides phage HNL05]QIG64622.1 hypothetical protein HNL35_40 [Bacteroides phage HNL35]